jgi:Ca-activated chloride channel family protein
MIEWLRPGWLLALPVGLALLAGWWRVRTGAGPWRRQIDADLLEHLAGRASPWSARLALGLAAATLVLACVALAGPSWRAQPAPLYRDLSARIVVLDLSPSMDAVDVVPSRLERARAAIVALLRESADAQLGLVVFGADAFTVAPLMNDPSALVHLLASLHTGTLPRAGSRPDLGLEMARTLLERAGVVAGDVILVGDGAGDERTLAAARRLLGAGFPLSVLGVGAPHGGPVRLPSGAFARTDDGDIVVAQPELEALERVARAGGGRFHLLGAETPRFARGAQAWAAAPSASAGESSVREDGGIWLVLLALPFAALLFRRGWLAGIAALAIALPPDRAQAFEWRDLWLRADQQAAAEFATSGCCRSSARNRPGARCSCIAAGASPKPRCCSPRSTPPLRTSTAATRSRSGDGSRPRSPPTAPRSRGAPRCATRSSTARWCARRWPGAAPRRSAAAKPSAARRRARPACAAKAL